MIYPLSLIIEASKAQVFISSLVLVAQLIGTRLESSAFIYGMNKAKKFPKQPASRATKKKSDKLCAGPSNNIWKPKLTYKVHSRTFPSK